MDDSLAPAVVEPLLRGRFGRPYIYVITCPSTQRLLADDAPEGAVAAAEEQSEGRGRLGREWHAPARRGVLASVLLRPGVEAPRLPELSVVAGKAVAAALRSQADVDAMVKFPNDVLVEGRKVAGVLAEAHNGRVVLGIGVNANQDTDELPDDQATSLRIETGAPTNRAALLGAILAQLEREYDAWVSDAVSG